MDIRFLAAIGILCFLPASPGIGQTAPDPLAQHGTTPMVPATGSSGGSSTGAPPALPPIVGYTDNPDGSRTPIREHPSANAPAPETELMRRKALTHEVSHAFATANFRKLDQMATQFRKEGSRLPSGVWKLSTFYKATARLFDSGAGRDAPYFEKMDDEVGKWLSGSVASPAPHLVYVQSLIARAWRARGYGIAAEVKQEAWDEHFKYLALAKAYLEAKEIQAAHDPVWYELMMNIAQSESWPQSDRDELIVEAIKRHPSYYEFYFAVIASMQPRWGGSFEMMMEFADVAVENTRKLEGESLYARIFWYAYNLFPDDLFTTHQIDWPRLKRGFDDLLARYPDDWNRNAYAQFACIAGDKPTTRRMFRELEGRFETSGWARPTIIPMCNVFQAMPD
jgi:hypothetical protein